MRHQIRYVLIWKLDLWLQKCTGFDNVWVNHKVHVYLHYVDPIIKTTYFLCCFWEVYTSCPHANKITSSW